MSNNGIFGWRAVEAIYDMLNGENGAAKEIPLSSGPVEITGLVNASVNANVQGQEIDFSTYRHLTVRYAIGGGTGTLQLKLQYKSADGSSWIDDADLAQASSVTSGAGKAFDGYFVNYSTIRVYATVTGSLTGVTCVISMKS